MNRREFSPKVRLEIKRRATIAGKITREGCGLVLGAKAWHIDHTIPDAQMIDKSRPLTAADGKLLGWDCCHKPKTAIDIRVIAKTKRMELGRSGARPSSNPIPGSKASGWRKPFNKPAERRT